MIAATVCAVNESCEAAAAALKSLERAHQIRCWNRTNPPENMPMHMNARSINAGNDTYRLTTKTWKEGAHVDWLEDAPTVAVGPDA